jgi:hypothetical protein
MTDVQAQVKFVDKVCPRCKAIRREQEFPSTASNADLDKIYAPLESVKREIRLLKTISGLEDEPLRCSLEVISLEDNARYSAYHTVGAMRMTESISRSTDKIFRLQKL